MISPELDRKIVQFAQAAKGEQGAGDHDELKRGAHRALLFALAGTPARDMQTFTSQVQTRMAEVGLVPAPFGIGITR